MAFFENIGKTAKPQNPYYSTGKGNGGLKEVESSFLITDDNHTAGDVFILCGAMSLADRVARLDGLTPALAAADNCDLGFYTKNHLGEYVEIDADILWDGITLVSATAFRNQLIAFNTSLDATKNIGELLGKNSDEQYANGIYLGLKLNDASTTASAKLNLIVIIEGATQ
jgi:hypothetical protein